MILKIPHVIRLLRPKQWVKNLFVFAALVFSHHLFDWDFAKQSLLGFLLFCATASTIYIINDIVDRDRDKLHPKKRHRPIPSGNVSIGMAMTIAFFLLCF